MNTFLSHYYPAMKIAPLPQEVSAVILKSIKNATNSSECLFRYKVGEDAKLSQKQKRICLIHNYTNLFQTDY